MGKGRKFGTMGGVFTPSILTILGVIMYMRLGWVVGNSDTLFVAILIVLLAHVVSVTTGLSVSSVATDKKIRGGGIYYMLSRSLGFPIGGAIGITLFLATALSISLYLIGFAESLLTVGADWFGIESITVNHLRIVGTIALCAIVTIAYISTSVAIKTQYIILGLIGLSLFSVFLGTSEGKGFDYSPILTSGLDTIGFATLFGVFFPAVTGFTAGVAMSGDLKNPKRSIPWGTMLAIGTGLLIYLTLTVFLYYKIPLAELRNNKNVLVDFSFIPQFVIAGIWGATLSSALGGILGGPRILQAMSLDSITPSFFAKGVGKENEPRRALLLIFVLAELGILIGELDVIAGIVAMFYMSAYLFINVSCFLEQWASPDFRPTFRVPLIISLLGTVATFLLMIQLDIIAAMVSVLLMGVIFLWLTRKQLELGSGDVWQSVWSSIVKLGLKNLNKKETHQRNWEPNILLFSGGTNERPHLLELSKAIAGRNGMISNFDLIENKTANTLFPKNKQAIKVDGDDDGSIFFRRQECRHIYEGIETIAQTYGFSGVEPNTVLLGWKHHSRRASKFTHMTEVLHKLDYNILFFDYDNDKGFGKKQKIDIWWRDLSHVSYFTVQLSKFLLSSKDWGNSEVRFIYLNNENSAQYAIKKAMARITHELKNFVTIEILNNEKEQKSFYDVVKGVSADADLIIIDLPRLTEENQDEFILDTDNLLKELGTTLIVKASSHFDKGKILDLGIEKLYKTDKVKSDGDFLEMNENLPSLYDSRFTKLYDEVVALDDKLLRINYLFVKSIYSRIESIYKVFAENIMEYNQKNADFFKRVNEIIEDIEDNRLERVVSVIDRKLNQYIRISETQLKDLSKKIKREYSKEDFYPKDGDTHSVVRFKKRSLAKARNITDNAYPLSTAQKYYTQEYIPAMNKVVKTLGNAIYEMNSDIRLWMQKEASMEESRLESFGSFVEQSLEQVKYKTYYVFGVQEREFLNFVLQQNDKLLSVNLFEDKEKNLKKPEKSKKELLRYSSVWLQNTRCLFSQLKTNFMLSRVKQILLPKIQVFDELLADVYVHPLVRIVRELKTDSSSLSEKSLQEISDVLLELGSSDKPHRELHRLKYMSETLLEDLPESIEIVSLLDLHSFSENQEDIVPEVIELKRIVRYLLDNEVFAVIEKLLNSAVNEMRIEEFKIENVLKILAQKEELQVDDTMNLVNEDLERVIERIEKLSLQFSQELQYVTSHCNEILTDEFIWTQSTDLNGLVRKEKSEKRVVRYSAVLQGMPKKLHEKIDENILKGKDIFLKNQYIQRYRYLENPHAKWRDFIEEVELNDEQKKRIPLYYQQLFLSKTKAPNIPLENRAYEWERFNLAYERFSNQIPGAILLLGEPLAGRSYLLENILNVKRFKNFYTIKPPTVLYADAQRMFERALKNSTGKDKSIYSIFEEMPQGTVLVFEDVELWWNRTEKGLETLELISKLIRMYGKKVLFLLSANIHFYTLIQRASSLSDLLLETIILQPLTSALIKSELKQRHLNSGLSLLPSKSDKFNPFKINAEEESFMKKVVANSGGNIGVAFHLWIGSMLKVKDNKMIYDSNKIFKSLPEVDMPMWDNIMLQVLLHTKLTRSTIFRIYKSEPREFIEENIQSLLRAGVIQPYLSPNIYEINKYAMVFVLRYLRRRKYIN